MDYVIILMSSIIFYCVVFKQELNLSFGEIGMEAGIQLAEALETKSCIKSVELNGMYVSVLF